MPDGFSYRRQQMVESLRRAGVTDEQVLKAMAEVPRHFFVPPEWRHQAYEEDVSVNIGEGQTISQPRVVAAMTQAAAVGPHDRVLEVGTGSGYQAAVLARLAQFVFTVERIPALARSAKQVLTVVEKRAGRLFKRELRGACFVPLIGRHGWEDEGR